MWQVFGEALAIVKLHAHISTGGTCSGYLACNSEMLVASYFTDEDGVLAVNPVTNLWVQGSLK